MTGLQQHISRRREQTGPASPVRLSLQFRDTLPMPSELQLYKAEVKVIGTLQAPWRTYQKACTAFDMVRGRPNACKRLSSLRQAPVQVPISAG